MTTTNATNITVSPITQLLIHAVRNNQPKIAKRMISLGANVNVKLPNGDHLLNICLNAHMGNILLNGGAHINARNAGGEAPIHTAMRRNIIDLTMLLIQRNADVNAQDDNGIAPLHLAEAPVINAALIAANADVNIQDNVGDTPLLLAIRIKGSPIVQALVDAAANKWIRNVAGNNAYDELAALIARRETELAKVIAAIMLGPLNSTEETIIYEEASAYGSLHAFNITKARAKVMPMREENTPNHVGDKQRLVLSY